MMRYPQFFFRVFLTSFIALCCLLASYGTSNSENGKEGSSDIDITELSLKQLMDIEVETVYSASKFEQKVSDAPSSVSIVTADEIKKYGYRTLADILRGQRSFYITYDRNYSYVGVRGFGRPGDFNARILVLVDGHKINDNIYDSALIGTEFILDVDLVERVEIIRGPGSSLYGSSAFFAVVNIITRSGLVVKGAEVSGEAGSFETFKGRASYGNKFPGGFEMLLSGTVYDSRGQDLYFKEFDGPDTNNGWAKDSDSDRFHSFFVKTGFKDITLTGGYVSREKSIPTASYGTVFNSPKTFTIDERGYLALKYEHSFRGFADINAKAAYDYYNYEGDYMFNWADPGDPPYLVVNKDYAKGQWLSASLQINRTLFEKHRVMVGLDYVDNFRQDQGNHDEEVYLDDKRSSSNWAVFFQDEFRVLSNLILNAGVRHDHYETFGGTTNPRLALIYSPFESTTLKLLYGTAFRAPNVYELFYDDGGIAIKANPALKPEKISTYELVWEQYLGKHFRMTTSGFYYKIRDLISQQLDPSDDLLIYLNTEEINAKGLAIELEGKGENSLTGRINYTYQHTKEKVTGKVLSNSPNHMAKLNIIVPLLKDKIFAGAEVHYTGKRKTLADKNIDAFLVANMTLFSQNLIKGLDISASVYNLFDKKYSDPGSGEHLQDVLEQDGRTFRAKLTYRF